MCVKAGALDSAPVETRKGGEKGKGGEGRGSEEGRRGSEEREGSTGVGNSQSAAVTTRRLASWYKSHR